MSAPRALADIESVRLVVGLEVHVELATRTKVFAAVGNPAHPEFDGAPPNTLIDPVVLGLPGALPVLSHAAVEVAVRVGLALNCRIAEQSKWDRKSYFYPDLPKGYQISQYDLPLCFDGHLDIARTDANAEGHAHPDPSKGTRRIGILRAHLEEDAGKLLHEAPGGLPIDTTIADYNRAGAPLLEIVTQPDITSADEAVAFCRTLRGICRFLGATEGVLQKGHMRFEPNINCVLTLRDKRLIRTPIVEVKNLNSFRAVRGAIEAELRDQPARWVQTGIEHAPGTKQTRGYDERALGESGGGPSDGGATVLQREKEDAHDYRYFPDPDIPVLDLDPAWVDSLKRAIPDLPDKRYRRFTEDFGLSPKEAAALIDERDDCLFFERIVDLLVERDVPRSRAPKVAANLVLQTGLKHANAKTTGQPEKDADAGGHAVEADTTESAQSAAGPALVSALGISPEQAAAIGVMREDGRLSAANADALFAILCEPDMRGRNAEGVAEFRALLTVRDDAKLDAWCDQVLGENQPIVEQIKAGKLQAVGRLVGAAMKLSAGAGDAKAIRDRLLEKIGVKE
ncbi:MAG: Asp-tRNA(Asn)/Glu-tRNA(Gln) amidotransferase subunit GatB [Phycisphaeraceae bacterium]|nr:Asp-tRNA(Asn)/Glu-tRNA(Gln) amidotransferase subunit GatB [Phycisphaeraceae bacterium]